MSLILFAGPAWADRVFWAEPPTDGDRDALQRTVPGATSAPLGSLITGEGPAPDPRALATLASELAAVRPLAQQFDGELQIMARLAKATGDVKLLHGPEEAEVLWRALVFEGFAVHRYFQDRLLTEPGAASYRVADAGQAWVAPWLDAAALMGPRAPIDEDIPEPAERLAWDAVRAHAASMPAAVVEVGVVAEGAQVWLDGQPVTPTPGERRLVVPGRHLFSVEVGGQVLLSADRRLAPGASARLDAPYGPREHEAFVSALKAAKGPLAIPAAAQVPLAGQGEPVLLGVPGGEGVTQLWRVDGTQAVPVAVVAPPRASEDGLKVGVALGAGWLSTGEFYTERAGQAPHDRATVNAFAPAFSGSARWQRGVLAVGAGVDGQLATGEYHTITTGAQELSTFVYPHAEVGTKWAQATVGYLFPWYLGAGVRGDVPVWRSLHVVGAWTAGIPLTQSRDTGPDYEPEPWFGAWAGAGWTFG
jgi:hypothetical protein